MECTQRLEFETPQCERICPEQIGFLGILGTKYPVIRGPNKVGRDPQTCSIVLNLNSISRQHAVINILNGSEFMLMDLDSANKTKLNNKTLQAYIPAPLFNGDTVQFGEVFGVFRLLEDNTKLPATQAIDVPDTPVASRSTRLGHATIPESPDISDRDDSFVVPSQPIPTRYQFKSPSDKFMKASKTIPVQPVDSKKFDNVYWNSSKKSTSFNLDDSLNESNSNIHDAETQAPFPVNNENTDSIFTAATQIPGDKDADSPSIHSLDTQLPRHEHLPAVCKINNQQDVEIDLFAANKENDISIFNAETQYVAENNVKPVIVEQNDIFEANTQLPENIISNRNETEHSIFTSDTQMLSKKDSVSINTNNNIYNADTQPPKDKCQKKKTDRLNDLINASTSSEKSILNRSDEIILFDELETQPFADDFQSQPLVPQEFNEENMEEDIPLSQTDTINDDNEFKDSGNNSEESVKIKPTKKIGRIKSDSSTECDDFDILPTQKIRAKPVNDEDLTDCEEELLEIVSKTDKVCVPKSSMVNFEDLATQVIAEDVVDKGFPPIAFESETVKEKFEDMLTQVIPVDSSDKDAHFEDLPTQVLKVDVSDKIANKPEEIQSPFKMPFPTPMKMKKKDISKNNNSKVSPLPKFAINDADNDKYYAATQELLDDLCSQREPSPELIQTNTITINSNSIKSSVAEKLDDDEILPSSVESYKVRDKFPYLECKLSPEKKYISDKSDERDGVDKLNQFSKSLSANEINDIIGVDVVKPKKVPSDPSDVEVTPKKVRPFKFMQTELPNSQEIKTSVSLSTKSLITESSSESETENDIQENTPVVFRKKKRVKVDAKKDLIKTFDLTALPTRIITRTRKPTAKLHDSDMETRNRSKNILKPKFLSENDEDMDSELITENITRLKNKGEKKIIKDNLKETTKAEDKSKADDVSTVHKVTNTRRNQRSKKPENTIDLTGNDEGFTKKSTRKADEKNAASKASSDLPIKSRSRRQTDKTKKKDDDGAKNDNDKVRKEDIVLESNPRLTRKTEKLSENTKKKETQGKITNYTISNLYDTKSGSTIEESFNSTNETNRSTRSTRSRNKDNSKSNEKKSNSPETTKNNKRGRSKPNDKKNFAKDKIVTEKETKSMKEDSQPKEEVRRSTRQRSNKEQNDSQDQVKHDRSTVYNISSESGTESPKGLKRGAGDIEVPSSKRTKSASSAVHSEVASLISAETGSNISRRLTPSRGVRPYHVLFTAFPFEEVKRRLEKLGAVVVSEASQCSVVVTLQLRRTMKLLCAVGLGKPIVGPPWVQACVDNNALVDPWQYLLKDEANEQRFQFDLEKTLSGPRNYLKGFNVSCTPSVLPTSVEMKSIVECSGGSWREGGPHWACVSCRADAALWGALRRRGARLVSTEFILTGVLRQQLIFDATLLK